MYQPRVTTQDVATAADVSRVTVSRVLNNHRNVTEGVRQRVLRAASDLGYQGRRSRLTLVGRGRQPALALRNIGFLFTMVRGDDPPAGNPFWSLVLDGVEQEASRAGMHVTYRSLAGLADQPGLLVDSVRAARMDGALLVGPVGEETVRALMAEGRPLVLVDNAVPGLGVDAVVSDGFEGGRAAVEHLARLGHRQMAFIGGPVWSVQQRALGYATALREAGLEPDPRLAEEGLLGISDGYAACQRLLAAGAPFTALFCGNDEMAIGAMRALHEAGLAVPGDVSVVGFDDIQVAQHLVPPLTTVHVDKEAIGSLAVRRLVARALDHDVTTSTTSLHVTLVKRGTTAPPR